MQEAGLGERQKNPFSLEDSCIVFTFPDFKGCPKFFVSTERFGKEGRFHQGQFAVNAVNASYAMPLCFV